MATPKKGMDKPGWRPQAINSGNKYIDNQDAGIQLDYDLLDSALKQGASVQKGIYHGATASTRHAYDTGSAMLKQASDTLQSQLGGQLHGLGLDEASAASLADIQSGLAGGLGDMARMRTNDLASLTSQGATAYSVARDAVTGAAREKAQTRVTARTELEKVLAQMRAEEEQARAQVEIARINAAAARHAASSGGGSGMDANDMARLQGQNMENDRMKYLAENGYLSPEQIYNLKAYGDPNGPGSAGPAPSFGHGQQSLEGFFNSPGDWGNQAGVAGPVFRSSLNDITSWADARARGKSNMGSSHPLSAYDLALQRAKRYGALNSSLVRQGVQSYYGRP